MSDKSAWLRANLPCAAAVAYAFAGVFGRDGFKVAFASENGHVLGKRFEGDGVKLSETLVGPWNKKAVK